MEPKIITGDLRKSEFVAKIIAKLREQAKTDQTKTGEPHRRLDPVLVLERRGLRENYTRPTGIDLIAEGVEAEGIESQSYLL